MISILGLAFFIFQRGIELIIDFDLLSCVTLRIMFASPRAQLLRDYRILYRSIGAFILICISSNNLKLCDNVPNTEIKSSKNRSSGSRGKLLNHNKQTKRSVMHTA